MADPVVAYSVITQGVESNGWRSVEALLDFDTGTWNVDDLGIPIDLTKLGLTRLEKAYQLITNSAGGAGGSSSTAYTQAIWVVSNTTPTYAYFVDIATNGTKAAPRLVIYSAGAILTGALDAAAQVRIRFIGT